MKRVLFAVLFSLLLPLAGAEILSPNVKYYAGDTFAQTFTIHDATGSAVNGDATPTITILRSGTSVSISTSLVNVSAGLYALTFTIPTTWDTGNILEVVVTATTNGISGKAVIYRRRLVNPAASREP